MHWLYQNLIIMDNILNRSYVFKNSLIKLKLVTKLQNYKIDTIKILIFNIKQFSNQ